MAQRNPKAGHGRCQFKGCDATVWFRQSPQSGKLSYTCEACDRTAYADAGGKGHRDFSAAITEPAAPAPAPAPPAPAPAKTGKAAASFGLGAL